MADADHKPAGDARTAPVAVWQELEKMSRDELLVWRKAEVINRSPIADRNLDMPFAYGWYPAMLSADLAVGQVKPLRYFSQDLVIIPQRADLSSSIFLLTASQF